MDPRCEARKSIAFILIHAKVHRTITLVAKPMKPEVNPAWLVLAGVAASALMVFLGGALVLLRPSLTTWGFFLYCLSYAPGGGEVVAYSLPSPGPFVMGTYYAISFAVGWIGLVLFSLTFLNEPIRGWRLTALRLTPAFIIVLVAYNLYWFYQWMFQGGPPGELLMKISLAAQIVGSIVVGFLLIDTYIRAQDTAKQRMRWIVVGFCLFLLMELVLYVFRFWGSPALVWVSNAAATLVVIIVPLTFAYAVVKHRVIDVSFVVGQSLVYGVLIALVIAVFAAIDWLMTKKLAQSRFEMAAYIAAALALGFVMKSAQQTVNNTVNFIFFRHRHRAQNECDRILAAIYRVTSLSELTPPYRRRCRQGFRIGVGRAVRAARRRWLRAGSSSRLARRALPGICFQVIPSLRECSARAAPLS